jgi:hypothetical protein
MAAKHVPGRKASFAGAGTEFDQIRAVIARRSLRDENNLDRSSAQQPEIASLSLANDDWSG